MRVCIRCKNPANVLRGGDPLCDTCDEELARILPPVPRNVMVQAVTLTRVRLHLWGSGRYTLGDLEDFVAIAKSKGFDRSTSVDPTAPLTVEGRTDKL